MRLLCLIALLGWATPVCALNKQGARSQVADRTSVANLSGYLFAGGFLFNPSYAARPNNSGLALFRFGLHLDLDFWGGRLTLSYDENSLTDGSSAGKNPALPSEHDHIVGLLSTWPFPHDLALTVALHFEFDGVWTEANLPYRQAHPEYSAGYSQSYLDSYARLAWAHGPYSLYGALGAFLWNPSYAARPDNAGLAFFRYVLHGELAPTPWLSLRLDFNFFSDRDQDWVTPTELDAVSEVAFKWRAFELRFTGEADVPIGNYPSNGPHPAASLPGLKQYYLSLMLMWNFDIRDWIPAKKRRLPRA